MSAQEIVQKKRQLAKKLSDAEKQYTLAANAIKKLQPIAEREKTHSTVEISVENPGDLSIDVLLGDKMQGTLDASKPDSSVHVPKEPADNRPHIILRTEEGDELVGDWEVESLKLSPLKEEVSIQEQNLTISIGLAPETAQKDLKEAQERKDAFHAEVSEIRQQIQALSSQKRPEPTQQPNTLSKKIPFMNLLTTAWGYTVLAGTGLWHAKNFFIFAGAVGIMHYYGDDLAL